VKRLYALQYLRAIAALVVVYSHATIQVPEWKSLLPYSGSYGVDSTRCTTVLVLYVTDGRHTVLSAHGV